MTDERDVNADERWLEAVVAHLGEPVDRSPGVVDAVVAAATEGGTSARGGAPGAGGPVRARGSGLWRWLTGPRLALSPLSAAGWAAAVAALVLLAAAIRAGGSGGEASPESVTHQFVLVAPGARSVSLVGDFNGWDPAATPLARQGDAWTVELELEPGRHVYSFVVNGEDWVPDVSAPRAAEDDFGRPSSVLLVGRGT